MQYEISCHSYKSHAHTKTRQQMNDQNAGLGAFKQEVFGKLEGGQLKKAEILSTSIPFSEDIFEHHV